MFNLHYKIPFSTFYLQNTNESSAEDKLFGNFEMPMFFILTHF